MNILSLTFSAPTILCSFKEKKKTKIRVPLVISLSRFIFTKFDAIGIHIDCGKYLATTLICNHDRNYHFSVVLFYFPPFSMISHALQRVRDADTLNNIFVSLKLWLLPQLPLLLYHLAPLTSINTVLTHTHATHIRAHLCTWNARKCLKRTRTLHTHTYTHKFIPNTSSWMCRYLCAIVMLHATCCCRCHSRLLLPPCVAYKWPCFCNL